MRTSKIIFSVIFGLLVSGIISGSVQPAYAAGQLYGLTSSGGLPSTLFSISTSTGAATQIGTGVGFSGCGAMDYDTVGKKMYAVCGNSGSRTPPYEIITINLGTGVGTQVATINGFIPQNVADISFRVSDNALLAMSGFGELFTVDKMTGVSIFKGSVTGGNGHGMAFSPINTLFQSQGFNPAQTFLESINPLNGAPIGSTAYTFLGFPALNFPRMNAFDFMPGSVMLFGSLIDGGQGNGPNYLTTINTNTAAVSHVGLSVNGLDAIAFLPDALVGGTLIPIESTSLILVGAQMTASWMIPVIVAGAGIVLVFVRKSTNK